MIWDCIVKWLGIIGSVASIIGLPMAIKQLVDVKKRLKNTEEITKRFLDRAEREKLELVIKALTTEQSSVLKLKLAYDREGVSPTAISNKVDEIVANINSCVHDLPTEYDGDTKPLKEAIDQLSSFEKCKDCDKKKTYIREAESFIESGINSLKKRTEQMQRTELNQMAKSE